MLAGQPATVDGLTNALRRLYGAKADDAIKALQFTTDAEARQAATALASSLLVLPLMQGSAQSANLPSVPSHLI